MNPPRYFLGGFFVFPVSMAPLERALSPSVASASAGSGLGEIRAFVAATARLDSIWTRREATAARFDEVVGPEALPGERPHVRTEPARRFSGGSRRASQFPDGRSHCMKFGPMSVDDDT